MGGVGEKALLRFLSDRPNIKTVYLCLDSDEAGNDACSRLVKLMPEGYTVHRLIPLFKDWNEVLQHRAEITDGKYLREAVYGLKEPPQEETVEIIRMSEVDTQTVEWLWEPYIPFGKVTIVQGNPGEGKTTFALRLAAACTTGGTLPGMKPLPPFQVIYQTAEDGLGDTVKPRLIEAEADLDRVLVIDEAKRELTLSDERIEKAITQNGARLIILDPIQAYMGEKTDMNRANEVRPMFRRLADVAERTGCAVILIGHLNKAAGGQSAYRGLGSIDFRAAARSVLLIGRVKREPNVRVIVHDKSSLAPEGKPVAFCLDPKTGFSWIGEYDITADELLSGAGGNTATKTEQAERLIKGLGENLRKIAMHTTNEFVTAAVNANHAEGVATWCYFDEFHILLRDPLTASYFVAVWKMLRKKGCVPSALTQNVKDLLASREIENILDNTDFMVLLSQAQSDRAILAKQLGISEHQLSYITHSNSGEGLLFYGNVTIPFVDRFPRGEIYDLLTTRPEDLAHERTDE